MHSRNLTACPVSNVCTLWRWVCSCRTWTVILVDCSLSAFVRGCAASSHCLPCLGQALHRSRSCETRWWPRALDKPSSSSFVSACSLMRWTRILFVLPTTWNCPVLIRALFLNFMRLYHFSLVSFFFIFLGIPMTTSLFLFTFTQNPPKYTKFLKIFKIFENRVFYTLLDKKIQNIFRQKLQNDYYTNDSYTNDSYTNDYYTNKLYTCTQNYCISE
jgi:hypothetical protein